MKPLTTADSTARVIEQSATELEAFMLKQVLHGSGAFNGDPSIAGSTLTQGLFVDALADAVAKADGMGLASLLARGTAQALGASGASPGARVAPVPDFAPGAAVTSGFGARLDPLTHRPSTHTGVDLGAPEGTPIPSAADGVVVSAGARGGYGNAVEVAHPDSSSTLYAHMSEVRVTPGERVTAGETLGLVGQTGRTTGPHLHLEVRRGGRFIDPRVALKAYGLRVESTGGGEP